MAASALHSTPSRNSSASKCHPSPGKKKTLMDSSSSATSASEFRSRFEAFNRLQAASVAFGEKLPIPEIVVLGGQSDGKSSLLEALLGFRFNVREVEMGTRRPLVLQMVYDPTALEPRCRFQNEDSEDYGSPIVLASAVADVIRSRTEAHLKKLQCAVSAKPIVMRAEYAHCPNLTIIDTPGFVLKAKKGEPENTPDEILNMVKSLARPPHRLLLFLQQSSVEWCSSLWLDAIRDIDPTFRRSIIVISKFDNRLKEFTERWEVDRYLSASGYLGENTHPYFVALPKDRGAVSNEEFRRQISQVDADILHHLRENVKGGFSEEKYGPFIGFSSLRQYLEAELQKRYKEAAPSTLVLLEQRCSEIGAEIARTESKLNATSDISHLRRSAMLHAASICTHVGILIDGASDPPPEQWGKTTEEEQSESGIASWPGIKMVVRPPNSSLKLYGGAAFERVMHEFRCATYSLECPQVSREKVANILLAHAGRGSSGGVSEAAAEIARSAARAWLSPLLDMACERLAYVLRRIFDIAMERNRNYNQNYFGQTDRDMDGYIGFHAALRRSYNNFIEDLMKQCKQMVRHHLDSVTSPYSQICYGSDLVGGFDLKVASKYNQISVPFFLDLSVDGSNPDKENILQEDQHTTPAKGTSKEPLRESQLTIPETPSPNLPSDSACAIKKENGLWADAEPRKRLARVAANGRGSSYSDICSLAAQHFAKIREVLVERNVSSTLNSGFLTPCKDRLFVAIGLDLFAVTDEKFMDMFVAPGAVDLLQNECQSLHKRHKVLKSCLTEFKNIARTL